MAACRRVFAVFPVFQIGFWRNRTFFAFVIAYNFISGYNVYNQHFAHMRVTDAWKSATEGATMTSFLLSADIPYADIAFFVVVALGLILGVIRGFSKSFKGVFLTIAIMLAALLLITPTFDSVRNLDMFKNMETSITEKIESGDKIFSQKIIIRTDGETGERKYYVEVSGDDGTSEVELENSMGDGFASSIKGKFALWLAQKFITDDGQTIGGVAGTFASDIIVAVIMFVVYCVALGLICWLLRKIFAKMHTSESSALKAVDRTFGAIVSTAFALVFILVVLAILSALKDKLPTVDEALSSSTVCGYFYQNNPVAKLFAEIFG